ncbi:MAG: NAD(P)-dependent oxidoreductase [Candidatus Staskawiczbacteria bacterium]|jgi:nucleoside-diphosphate-sugar epimerase
MSVKSQEKYKRILITGGAGFIGANLARKLISLPGFKVFIIEKRNTNLWRLKDIINKVNIKYVDLENQNGLSEVINDINPSVVFHLASYGVYSSSQSDLRKMVRVNIEGTLNLIDSLKSHPISSFVYTGTCFEYKEKKSKINENDIIEPLNFYAITKFTAELFLKKLAEEENMPIINLRLFTPYGYHEDGQRVIPHIILSALKNKKIELTSPDNARDFIFIEDVVNLFSKIARNNNNYHGEIFNIGSGGQQSVRDVVSTIEKLLGKKLDVKYGSRASYYRKDRKFFSANNAKAKSIFNWQIEHDFESGIGKTIDWFKKNKKLYL